MQSSPTSDVRNPPFWVLLWRFSRPHTIIGTSLSVWALAALAIDSQTVSVEFFWACLITWIACLSGNIFIVGLNQLSDVAIDRINKPQLPLAAGHLSRPTGRLIVWICGILALGLSLMGGFWLTITVWVSIGIGICYSLPPVRLKRFPLLAATCIFTVRGVIVNLGLFAHFQAVLLRQAQITPIVWLLTGFIVVFTVAIALFKDVPDLEGDRQYRIQTFTLLLGKTRIFQMTLGIIFVCYGGMVLGGGLLLSGFGQIFFLAAHLLLALLLWWRSRRVDLSQKQAIASFYQFIWTLFFLEYLIFPTAFWFAKF